MSGLVELATGKMSINVKCKVRKWIRNQLAYTFCLKKREKKVCSWKEVKRHDGCLKKTTTTTKQQGGGESKEEAVLLTC